MALSIRTKRALLIQAMQTLAGKELLKNVICIWAGGGISQSLCDAIDNDTFNELTDQMIDGVLDLSNQGKIDKTRASKLVADLVKIKQEI